MALCALHVIGNFTNAIEIECVSEFVTLVMHEDCALMCLLTLPGLMRDPRLGRGSRAQ